jgi:hypothetical protein
MAGVRVITLDDVAATATPGARARSAASLIDQSRREIEAARLIQRAAINELIMHGASDSEVARLCDVPLWMVDHVRSGVGR